MNELISILQEIEEQNKFQIQQIMLQKKRAIKTYEYDEAEQCDKMVQEIKNQENSIKKDKIYQYFENEIYNINSRSKNSVFTYRDQLRQNEEQIREMISKSYHSMQKKHREEIAQLEADFKRQKELESIRSVPESVKMLELSQKEAFIGNYQRARELKAQGEELAKKERQSRLEAVEKNYQQNLQKLFDSTKADLMNLSQKLNDLLEQTKQKSEMQIHEEENLLQTRFYSHLQQTILFLTQNCEIENKELMQQELSQILQNTLTQLGIPVSNAINFRVIPSSKTSPKPRKTNVRSSE